MALFINDNCISCGACEAECPNEAIEYRGHQYAIVPERCTECVGFRQQPACQDVCPSEACVRDPNHPESKPNLIRKALALHPDDESVRRRIRCMQPEEQDDPPSDHQG
ncbi:MAG TPA: YfhL family 4Fe-4S dicluster ferredoxin [Polyangiaceae bacterium]|nr:YfhL family 4Fe-4S dicluster ferredoxin [Polyangiaceae bacterium]